MKQITTLIICLAMTLPLLSQTISKTGPRVKSFINSTGDTLIEMTLADAKTILIDVVGKQRSDSIISVYVQRDSISSSIIALQKSEIKLLQQKAMNDGLLVNNLDVVVANNNKIVSDLNDVIKQQKKEILKQKFLKVVGFTAAVAIPILMIIFHL